MFFFFLIQFTAFEAITEVMWRVNPRCTDQKWKPG